jgi:hypothetical protein
MQCNYAAVRKSLKIEKRERRRMPKSRTIDETPDNHQTFLECLQLEFENLPQMMFLEGTKDHDLVDAIHPGS